MPTCSIDGCPRPAFGRGWCKAHHTRYLRHGDPLGGRVADGWGWAFLEDVLAQETDECVEWPLAPSQRYGVLGGRGVHTIVCERTHGPRPDGMEASHTCNNPRCANPRHLLWETHAENLGRRAWNGTDLRGERNPNAKLTEADVAEIRALWSAGGLTQREIGEQFGVRQANVSDIVLNKRWR